MKHSLRAYLELLKPFRANAIVVVVLGFLAPLIESIALIFLVPVINSLASEPTTSANAIVDLALSALEALGLEPTTGVLLSVFAILAMGAAVVRYGSVHALVHLSTTAQEHMRSSLYAAIAQTRWTAFTAQRPGYLIKGLDSDVNYSTQGLQNGLLSAAASLSVIVYLGLAFAISWQFTLIVVGVAAVAAYPVLRYIRRGRRVARRARVEHENLAHSITDLIGGAKSIFSSGLRTYSSNYFADIVERFRRSRQMQLLQPERLKFGAQFVGILLVFVVFAILIRTEGSLGAALVWIAAFVRLAPRVAEAQRTLMVSTSYSPWLERWQRLLREASGAAIANVAGSAPELDHELTFKNIGFAYPDREATLENVNFSIRANECIAITGPSGAGKTTLLDLMTGLLSPTRGEISIDGTRLDDVDVEAWQARLGVVLQGSLLLNASVTENVALSKSTDIDPDAVNAALEQAHATEFVAALPDGAATMIGHLGTTLSGGQAQRIAIARALYRHPTLLLMDEPTSNLDAVTKHAITDAIELLRGDMTIVLISHDDDLPRIADRVLHCEGAHVTEVGRDGRAAS